MNRAYVQVCANDKYRIQQYMKQENFSLVYKWILVAVEIELGK